MTRLVAFLPILAALFLVVCEDGHDIPFNEEEARTAAESSLLIDEDFPDDWDSVSPIDPGPNAFQFDLPDDCTFLNDLSEDDRSVAGALSDAFFREPQSVSSHSVIFTSDQEARNRIDRLRGSVDSCKAPLEEQMRRLLEEPGVVVSEFSFEALPSDTFGDESVAIRMAVTGEGPDASANVVQDLIILRVGNVTAGLDYTTSDAQPDSALERNLMAILEKRAGDAADSLKRK